MMSMTLRVTLLAVVLAVPIGMHTFGSASPSRVDPLPGQAAPADPGPSAVPVAALADYEVRAEHPRMFVTDIDDLRKRARGPLKADYAIVKQRADAAVQRGSVQYIDNKWAVPEDLMNCGLCWLIESDRRYADLVVKQWGDGSIIRNREASNFGYHAIAFDWIFDALTDEQRKTYGDALGSWLDWFTDTPEILLKSGHWEYNQTWAPNHLNVMNTRDGITPKLLVALAILGADTSHERDARTFLDSWHQRIPAECIPAFNRMGGVWSESYGHGAYGPVSVIPYAFHAWRTATGIDLFAMLEPHGYPVESPRWVAFTTMPHNDRTAYIDDGSGATPAAFCRAAPMLGDPLSQWFSGQSERFGLRERWQRVACHNPDVKPVAPEDCLPLAYCFPGAGHVYMRSDWSADATWAFFGAGPQFGGHARDDEGHFLICKGAELVSRQGGQGHNDDDHYVGGSLVHNVVTIFDPDETFRRNRKNENDGGMMRHVYEGGPYPRERGHLVAYEHTDDYTYAAADLTKAYRDTKTVEVTRQFLYLRGRREYFVIFDRVEATKPQFRRHFFLHVTGKPEGDAGEEPLTFESGGTKMHVHTLLPDDAEVFVRDDPAWGHPLEPTAQYSHTAPGREKPPICPYRIEVGDPGRSSRTLFLHVLELSPRPSRIRKLGSAGFRVGEFTVRFNPTGRLGVTINGTRAATDVKTDAQYEEEDDDRSSRRRER